MTSIPKNFPIAYVSSIGVKSIVLVGNPEGLMKNYSRFRVQTRKVGGVWGGHELAINYFDFKDDAARNQCIQSLIEKSIPFSINDRKNPDAFKKALHLREEKLIKGVVTGVEVLVSDKVNVRYQID